MQRTGWCAVVSQISFGNFGKITEAGTTEAWSRAGNHKPRGHAFALMMTVGGYVAAGSQYVRGYAFALVMTVGGYVATGIIGV